MEIAVQWLPGNILCRQLTICRRGRTCVKRNEQNTRGNSVFNVEPPTEFTFAALLWFARSPSFCQSSFDFDPSDPLETPAVLRNPADI